MKGLFMNSVKIPIEMFQCDSINNSPLVMEWGTETAEKLSQMVWTPIGERLFEFVYTTNDTLESVIYIGLDGTYKSICGIHIATRIKGRYSIPLQVWNTGENLIDKLFTHLDPNQKTTYCQLFAASKWQLIQENSKEDRVYSAVFVQNSGMTIISVRVLHSRIIALSKTVL